MRKLVVTAVVAFGLLLPGPVFAKAHHFKNCTDMHHTYKHGVGKPHAHDSTTGTPVTNFKKSKALYKANKSMDRDHDGIACEAR